jgi:hypothetical protein
MQYSPDGIKIVNSPVLNYFAFSKEIQYRSYSNALERAFFFSFIVPEILLCELLYWFIYFNNKKRSTL